MPPPSSDSPVILCADDFGISSGVTAGIEELAAVGRVSAASAIVTLPSWGREGFRLAALRPRIAIGLHVNLTLGAPLAPMADLAPGGSFPPLNDLLMRCFSGRSPSPGEVALEVWRQIDRFEEGTGHAPDFIDGHQHVHVLPGIRQGFLRALLARFPERRPLVRDPSDSFAAILARRRAAFKALSVGALASGFGAALRRAGFATNHGFSGFSEFGTGTSYAEELESFFRCTGRRHLTMCHPGYADAELSRLDAVVDRRRDELSCLLAAPDLETRIWHLGVRGNGHQPVWPEEQRAPDALDVQHCAFGG